MQYVIYEKKKWQTDELQFHRAEPNQPSFFPYLTKQIALLSVDIAD